MSAGIWFFAGYFNTINGGKTAQFELPQKPMKLDKTDRISVVRDVADRFWGWQQLTNYRDLEKKIGALGGDILKKQRFFENYAK